MFIMQSTEMSPYKGKINTIVVKELPKYYGVPFKDIKNKTIETVGYWHGYFLCKSYSDSWGGRVQYTPHKVVEATELLSALQNMTGADGLQRKE